jgi:hypothetical protein
VLAVLVACTPNEASTDEATIDPAVPSGTVAVPVERLTPFCQAMIDLSDRLETDPPDDVEALILETYIGIADVVPPEIADDFNAVLAELQGSPVPTVASGSIAPDSSDPLAAGSATTDPVDGAALPAGDADSDEGRLPSDNPTDRLNGYVNFACRDSANNPGPPATEPLDDIAPPTTQA